MALVPLILGAHLRSVERQISSEVVVDTGLQVMPTANAINGLLAGTLSHSDRQSA